MGDMKKVKGGAKQANRTDAYKRKEMEYSEKMYEESKRPKMDYKRAGQEAREGGMSFKDGGSVSKPKRSAPEERAAEVGMERQEKTFANANKRDDDTYKKWEGRGTSGEEMAADEYEDTMRKFKDEYAGAVEGTFRDIKNAKRYGRDAYISRGFGQGNSDTPKDKGSQKFAEGGMVNATVRPMGMMGGGNVGYTHGGKVDGCSSIQVSGRRPGKTY